MRNVRSIRPRILRSVQTRCPAMAPRPITKFKYRRLDGNSARKVLDFLLAFMQVDQQNVYKAVTNVIFNKYLVGHSGETTPEFAPRFNAAYDALRQLASASMQTKIIYDEIRNYGRLKDRNNPDDFLVGIAHHVETLAFYLGLMSDEELEQIGFTRADIPPTVTLQHQPAVPPQTTNRGHIRFKIVQGLAA